MIDEIGINFSSAAEGGALFSSIFSSGGEMGILATN